jgi:hypothetical protein
MYKPDINVRAPQKHKKAYLSISKMLEFVKTLNKQQYQSYSLVC